MRRNKSIGLDGVVTLILSNIVIAASIGLSLVLSLFYVVRTARLASTGSPYGSALVVLGMRLENGAIANDYAMRLTRAVNIYKRDDDRLVIAVGGITDSSMTSEAAMGEQYLVSYGVNPKNVLKEEASRHTLENLRNIRSILKSNGLQEFSLITNRYHLARSLVISEGLGLRPHLCAAEEKFNFSVKTALRLLLEAYYVHWYKVGSAWSHMTRNKKSLERIS